VIANSYPRLGWLAPRYGATVPIAPAGPAAPDQQQLDVRLGDDLHAMRLNLDQIVAGQELMTRSIDKIATSITAGQEPTTYNTDQAATSQELTTRSSDQTAATITTGQGQMTRNTDQTTTSVDEAPSAKASSTIESRGDAVSLRPAMPDAGLAQTSLERGKQLAAASGHDASCFPSASAVLQNHPAASPTWTLRAPGHEGTQCWRVAAPRNGSDHRPSAGDHRRETMPTEKEIVGTTEKGLGLSAPFARYAMPPE
jgi:hypothetical protein